MSKKLGERLIERQLITGAQLERALTNQLMLGGHLGTCLLELGFLNEESLGRTLADTHGVPYASPDIFTQIREPTTKLFSRRIVDEFRAIPLERSGKKLFAAMIDPHDIGALDALKFASGLAIVPWVAPEFRIFEAMEKYYGIARRPRYIALSAVNTARDAAAGRPAAERMKTIVKETAAELGAAPDPVLPEAEFGYGESWVEIAKLLVPEDPLFNSDADELPPVKDPHRITRRLCNANERDEIARAVLDELASKLARSTLFAVRDHQIALWAARGFSPGRASLEPFPFSSCGIFRNVFGDDHYRGPLGSHPNQLEFYEWLGVSAPSDIVLVPVHLNDRLVAILYGDGGVNGRVQGATEDYVRLSRMLAVALTMLVYKNKIRAIGSFTSGARVK